MKAFIGCMAAMLLGMTIGWNIGRDHYSQVVKDVCKHVLDFDESTSALDVLSRVRAIELISCNDTQGAVRELCKAIERYYYGFHSNTNAKNYVLARGHIDKLIDDNKNVADIMTNSFYRLRNQ
jgi:hypothetical protein